MWYGPSARSGTAVGGPFGPVLPVSGTRLPGRADHSTVGELIERAAETAAIRGALARAAGGTGGSLLLSGPAGIGKTALLRHAHDSAQAAGFTLLSSSPTPVSATLSHAVVRDWLLPRVRVTPPGTRPFDGPAAALAASLRDTASATGGWTVAELDYALAWVLEGLADAHPLLLVVDDVQWADVGSLQLLDLLSARIPGLPALLLLARRTGEPSAAPQVLDRLAGRAVRVEPAPLSVAGVDEVLRRLHPAGVPHAPAAELHHLTGGIPFLLQEMLRAGPPAEAPRTVVESVRERLERLGPDAVTVARAVAVLDDEASPEAVAAITGRSVAALAGVWELLTEAGIVTLGTWEVRAAHPLVAEAVLSGMSAPDRATWHARAADHLRDRGRPDPVVAAHLLHTVAGDDPEVVGTLRAAAEEAQAAGASAVAARLLLRAAEEHPAGQADPDLFAQAASAHLRAGMREEAGRLWALALERVTEPVRLARMLADRGRVQMTMGEREAATDSYRHAVRVLGEAGHGPSSPDLRAVLVRMGLNQTMYEGARAEIVSAVEDAVRQPVTADTRDDRLLFAIAAADLAVRATDRPRARDLALRALGEGRLLDEETADGFGFYVASGVLSWVDAYAENLRALEAAMDEARRRGSVVGFATASYCRGLVRQRTGELRDALEDFQPALDLRSRGWTEFAVPAVAGAALTHVALGRLEDASALEADLRRAAERGGFVTAQPLAAAGLLRAALGDHEQALADYRAAARLMGEHPDNPSIVEWRELSAWSLLALDRTAEAHELAEEAVGLARRWGAPRALGFALRTLARASERDEAIDLLTEAADLLGSCGCTDYGVRTRIDLAARLLEGGGAEQDAAVDLLREAVEEGRRSRVEPVVRRASRLLLLAGHPVADPVVDPARTLTPGERRVAELATTGLTNREIAQRLFVTVKAVEWHLSNTYRKLGISSRRDLADALYSGDDPSSSSAM